MRRLLVGSWLVALGACTFDGTVAGHPNISCEGGQCPTGFVCQPRLGRCLPANPTDREAPSISDVVITPTLVGHQGSITVAFTASERLGLAADVSLAQGGRTARLSPVGTTDDPQPRLTFSYQATERDLEGPSTLFASLIDEAGNEAVGLAVGAVTFDFTPPTVREATYVAPRSADGGHLDVKAEEPIVVRLVLTEAIEPNTRLSAYPLACDGGAPTFVNSSSVGGLLDFIATPPTGLPGCEYGLQLNRLVDLAGNVAPASTLVLPVTYRVLEFAPSLEALSTERFVDGGTVLTSTFSRRPGFDELAFRFRAGPTTSGVTATFDLEPIASCTRASCQPASDGKLDCFCRRPFTANDVEGLHSVLVTVRDGPGQTRSISAPVKLDLTPPGLVPGTAQVSLEPSPSSPLPRTAQLGVGGRATLSFTVDEPLGAPPVLSSAPSTIPFTSTAASTTSFAYAYTLTADAGLAGAFSVRAALVDQVGNEAMPEVVSANTPLTIDGVAPSAPDVMREPGITLRRAPWGEGDAVPRFVVSGLAGTVEPNALLRVFDGLVAATATEVMRGVADGTGAFSLVLPRADHRFVWLSVVDVAGNESPLADVKNVEWVASLGGKQAGDSLSNPHNIETRSAFLRELDSVAAREPSNPSAAGALDTVSITAKGASDWFGTGPPTQRMGAAMQLLYDSARRRFVALTPRSMVIVESSTGATWAEVTPADPEHDDNPGIQPVSLTIDTPFAFDAARGKAVLLHNPLGPGGGTQTWEWNGRSWRLVLSGAASPDLPFATMTFDPGRNVMVLVGRRAIATVLETWEYDGARWTQVMSATTAPSLRSGHALTYVPSRQRVLLFGGTSPSAQGGQQQDDLWEWDGVRWTQLPKSGTWPDMRSGAAFVHDPSRGRTLLFGGNVTPFMVANRTWEWNGATWANVSPDAGAIPSSAVGLGGSTYDPVNRNIILLGQSSSFAPPVEVWRYGPGWQRAEASFIAPFAREDHAMAFDARRGRTVMFGGAYGPSPFAETWEYSETGWAERTDAGPAPSARLSQAMAYDSARGQVLLFGGSNSVNGGAISNAELWAYADAGWVLVADGGLPARYETGLAYDEARRRLVLFGGNRASGGGSFLLDGETWEFDGARWAKALDAGLSQAPAPRAGHRLAYDAARQRTVMFGGFTSPSPGQQQASNETWEWDGVRWQLKPDAGAPSARVAFDMAYVPGQGVTLMGGAQGATTNVGQYANDVWAFDGTRWVDVTPASEVTPRASHAVAYDSLRKRFVVWGGVTRTGSASGLLVTNTLEHGLDATQTPSIVVKLSFAGAAESNVTFRSLTARTTVGGASTTASMPTPGAALWVWDRGSFMQEAVNQSPLTSLGLLSFTTNDAARIARLLASGRQSLALALTPVGTNDTSPADLGLDYAEVTLRYRRP